MQEHQADYYRALIDFIKNGFDYSNSILNAYKISSS